MRRAASRRLAWLPFALVVVVIAALLLGRIRRVRTERRRNADARRDSSLVLVTGYCNCGSCCGWRRSYLLFGESVYNYGPMKGKPKKIGITATGTRAHHGTIAADPKVFPFGTHLYVPGYGVGTVEDIGGSIRGRHIDIWFPSHAEARAWGAQWLKVSQR